MPRSSDQAEIVRTESQPANRAVAERIVEQLYQSLRGFAHNALGQRRRSDSIHTTVVLHEALLRMLESDTIKNAPSRAFIYAAAFRTMNQVVVDYARRRDAQKRGGNRRRVSLAQALVERSAANFDFFDIIDAIAALAEQSERRAMVVWQRYFCNCTVEEVAANLDVSVATVEGDWRFARAWLFERFKAD